MATLKRLTNLGITLGIATTENMRNVLAADEQLHSRFRQVQLPRWNESEEFRALLAGLEAQLPFARRSYLDSQAVVRWLLSNRYATTGAVVDLVRDATLRVLACGGDVLALEALQEASVATLPPARNQGHA